MDDATKDRLIDATVAHWREHGRAPDSVFRLCREVGVEERDFYSAFASLDTVESAYWERLLGRVIGAVEAGPEWAGFTARQRLLAFLYAFFEAALGERSLILLRIAPLRVTDRPAFLRGFEARFERFADQLIAHGRTTGEIADRGRLTRVYPRGLYAHLRACLEFYARDTSEGFERTDAFIEKTVALAFDVARPQAIDSAVDLVRFLLPRR